MAVHDVVVERRELMIARPKEEEVPPAIARIGIINTDVKVQYSFGDDNLGILNSGR